MAVSAHLREAAKDERDALKRVIVAADFALVGVGTVAVLTGPAVGLLALVPAVIRWRSARELVVQDRLIADPARYDYGRPTRPEFELIVEQAFNERDAAEEALMLFTRWSTFVVGWQDALIRATERALGARERDPSHFGQHLEEIRTLLDETGSALGRATEYQAGLLSLLDRPEFLEADDLIAREGRDLNPEEAFWRIPDPTAARLFRMGAVASDFLMPVNRGAGGPLEPGSRRVFGMLQEDMGANLRTRNRLSRALLTAEPEIFET